MIRTLFEDQKSKNPFIKVSDLTYEVLLYGITSNSPELGERFTQEELCSLLGVSRTPVRAAIARLEQEGFVKQVKAKGIVVTSRNEICSEDMYTARACLETLACGLAADRMTIEECDALEDILARNRAAWKEDNKRAFYDTDNEFHLHVVECSKNTLIHNAYLDMHSYIQRGRYSSIFRPNITQKAIVTEHSLIFHSLKYGNASMARDAMLLHMYSCSANSITLWDNIQSNVRMHLRGPSETSRKN